MKKRGIIIAMLCLGLSVHADNPLLSGQFTADPTARVFGGKLYLYPSHDIPSPIDDLKEWFCMADYHVFSSDNLMDWTDHGIILDQKQVPWANGESYAMWAPDCVEKEGTYYFYFPMQPAGEGRLGFNVGVAFSRSPEDPFIPLPTPIEGIMGIDPCVLVDDDGSSYIYWSGMGIRGARLANNMLQLASEPVLMEGLPDGFKEGPFAFKREGKYYLTFPWVRGGEGATETLAYCMSDSPLGPWEFKGLIMEEWSDGCWTNHHSLVEYDGEWYIFYHHNDYSPDFDKNRSVCADRVRFAPDGTIIQVSPTLRGIGVADARSPLQIDRYSDISEKGAGIEFINPDNKFEGWKSMLNGKGAWVRYNDVDFKDQLPKILNIRARAKNDAIVAVTLADTVAPAGTVEIMPSEEWTIFRAPLEGESVIGVHDLLVTLKKGGPVEIDYIGYDELSDKGEVSFEMALCGTASAGTIDGTYFTRPSGSCTDVDDEGFIRRWMLLDPIDKPNRTNVVFTDSYLHDAFYHEYFPGQLTVVPKDGATEKVDGEKLQWRDLVSTGYNVHLYRYATTHGNRKYGVLFWAVTVVDSPCDYSDVRLSVGSNSASMWWLNCDEVLILSGDRRMVMDDACSQRISLKKGRNVLRGAVINGPGMSSFCVRFLDADGNPLTDIKSCM